VENAGEAYRLLFDQAGEMVCLLDLAGRFTSLNAAGEELTGYSSAELAGKLAVDLIAPEHQEEAVRQFQARLRGDPGRPPDETVLVTRDGTRVPIEVRSTLFYADGQAAGVLGLITDQSARVRAEQELAERERHYRLLAENSTDLVACITSDGEIRYLSPASELLLGYRAEEVVGRSIDQVLHRDDLTVRAARRASIDDATEPVVMEVRLRHRDGRWLWFEASVRAVRDAGGDVIERQAALRPIEQRRQAEADLRDAEARFRSFFEFAPIGESIVDIDGKYLRANDALCALVGYPEPELVGKTFQEITHPDDLDADVAFLHRTLAGEISSYEMEKRYIHKLGHEVWVLLSVSLVRAADGSPSYFISQIQDISERKAALDEIELSASRLSDAQHVARIGSWESDFATGAVTMSTELYRLFEIDPSETEMSLEHLLERIHPDDRAKLAEANVQAPTTTGTNEHEYRICLSDGSLRWIHARAQPYYVNGKLVGRRGTSQDITERKHAEQQLADAELRYRTLVEQLPLCTYVRPLDMSLPNIYTSPQVEPMLGYPADAWQTDPDLLARIVHPDDRDRVLGDADRVRKTGEPVRDEYRYVAPDGRVVWVQDETYRLTNEHGDEVVQGFLLDISDRKRVEQERDRFSEQLHQAQKLEAIGRLAGGVAHDFNNMLTAIKGYSELLVAELEPGTRARDEAEQIKRAAEQASVLPAELLAFSRNQTLAPQLIDLDKLIGGVSSLLRHLISEAIDLVVVPSAEPHYVSVDPARVEPVLVNLALNARDAMPSGGTLTLSTGRVDISHVTASERQVLPGPYIVLTVTDDGEGMDVDTAARAFEPFFTTKPQGEGSGLGLASVYGTISQSGGFVSLESKPGLGTTFRIHLPAAERPAAVSRPAPEEPLPAPDDVARPARDGPLVLIAEDEELVRELVTRILEREGYDVHAAADGPAALQILERIARPVDVLVTDIVMPGMNGRKLAERVVEQSPGTSVVFMSGYSEEPPAVEGSALTAAPFLRKPFSPKALLEAVTRAAPLAESADKPASPLRRAKSLTCLVADDHPAVLEAVSRYLETAGIAVLARVGRADDALQQIEAIRPATALIDIAIEPFNGLELARRAAASAPETKVILYTGSRDPALLRQAAKLGVRGFVLKDTPLSDLVAAIDTVAGGGTYVDSDLAGALAASAAEDPGPQLTQRERQVLSLVSAGNTNDRVAAELGISAETVQSHVRNVMGKLDADTRTEAVATALRQSLIS
jgi:two-component system cell cycle sensor histidine kinase/response regulator CckA